MTASALMSLAFYALVIETMLIILLIIPLISPAMWSRLFASNVANMVRKRGRVPFFVAFLFMGVIFYDASRVERESRAAKAVAGPDSSHHNIEHLNARLFRAQRDLYIAGFGLFFVFVIYRLVKMVSEIARLDASCTALMKQAESASRSAQALLSTGKVDVGRNDDKSSGDLKSELEKKNKEVEKLKKDLEAMRSQSESLSREYDRLAEEHSKSSKTGGSAGKKSD